MSWQAWSPKTQPTQFRLAGGDGGDDNTESKADLGEKTWVQTPELPDYFSKKQMR